MLFLNVMKLLPQIEEGNCFWLT